MRSGSRGLLLAMAGLALAAVGAALIAQYRFDMQPCPWCILQRVIYLLLAVVCVLGTLLPGRVPRRGAAVLALVLAACGAASAVYQHVVASQLYSCSMTFADKVLNTFSLEALWPSVFGVTASCADAAVSVLGVPFEYWSLALFSLLGLMSLGALVRR
jgi:protein dithiol:quinone oxidoreductase